MYEMIQEGKIHKERSIKYYGRILQLDFLELA